MNATINNSDEMSQRMEEKMSCQLDKNLIEETIRFHGHSCPGVAIGIRAAEVALNEMAGVAQADLVCVTETDMCGVDAIQFLTGCTFGKGNLIHRDYGKMAFSFYDRQKNTGIRLVLRPNLRGELDSELSALMAKSGSVGLSDEEQNRLQQLRQDTKQRMMTLPIEDLFIVQSVSTRPPRPARVLESLECQECGESTMESRTRRFGGRTLCIPCYEKVEQKV